MRDYLYQLSHGRRQKALVFVAQEDYNKVSDVIRQQCIGFTYGLTNNNAILHQHSHEYKYTQARHVSFAFVLATILELT